MPEGCLVYDYLDVAGVNIVEDWLKDQQVSVKAKVTTRLSALDEMPQKDWHFLNTEILHGDKDGLVAVRIGFRVAYRLLGCYGPTRNSFTLLACGTERGYKYIPLDIGETAFKRKALVEANPSARRVRHDFRKGKAATR